MLVATLKQVAPTVETDVPARDRWSHLTRNPGTMKGMMQRHEGCTMPFELCVVIALTGPTALKAPNLNSHHINI